MAQRPKLGPLTPPPLSGVEFLTEYQLAMKGLFDAASFPLTAIGGTANNVTASLAWDLDAGLIDGMKFTMTFAATNTGPMTLALNGAAPINLLDIAGGAMIAGAAKAGNRALLEYIGGAFRVLIGADASAADRRFYWRFTASATWTKPAGLSDDTLVHLEAWGGGGGGASGGSNSGGGGGGGGYACRIVRLGDLPSSLSVSIAAGGLPTLPGQAGGDTTIGTILIAYGGGGGASGGGSGGGALGKGVLGAGSGAPGGLMGGGGGGGGDGAGTTPINGEVGSYYGGGGGGAGSTPSISGSGAGALYGGGGGAGRGNTNQSGIPGYSVYGGRGGAQQEAGLAPAGGGGRAAAGARGEVRIWI